MDLQVRDISEKQIQKFEGYAAEILSTLGMDLNTPSTKDTPRRFIRALIDATKGYDGDPKLLKTFPEEGSGEPCYQLNQIVEGPIYFFALSEHTHIHFTWTRVITVDLCIGDRV
jgi:GTP cyclohydrolase I